MELISHLQQPLKIPLWILLNSFLIISCSGLKPNQCPPELFSCDSGECINLNMKCNGVKNCADGSDEFLCDCQGNFFQCVKPKSCIPKTFLCDGKNDCGDFSDEVNCHTSEARFGNCSEAEFMCHDNKLCIPFPWTCDGEKDCGDWSDELSCFKNHVLHCFGFKCVENEKCIALTSVCDEVKDCIDGSDEALCNKPTRELDGALSCHDNFFPCTDGSLCIPPNKVCDNVTDCVDKSDENENCGTGKCSKMNCSQHCMETPLKSSCYCDIGFSLSGNKCSDIDECARDEDLCSQICQNTQGSYTCSCSGGYIEINQTKCKAKGNEPILIYSTDSSIRQLHLRSKINKPILENLNHIVGLASDFTRNRIYFCDITYGEESIMSVDINGTDLRPVVIAGIQVPEDVAIDWMAKNIYFTDSAARHIAVCSLIKDSCTVIIQNQHHKPRAIELDVDSKRIYWTDWGQRPHIGRSRMDGTDLELFVTENVVWPNGLAIDYLNNRLYWCDGKLVRIESIKLDGTKRKVLFKGPIYHPFYMTVFENTLFWTDWQRHSIEACDKKTTRDHVSLIKEFKTVPMAVHIFHPLKQLPSRNACSSISCSHQCLLKANKIAVCVCPAGFALRSDNMTCYENESDVFVLLAYGNKLAKFHPLAIGLNVLREVTPKTDLMDVSAMVSEENSNIVYIADSIKKHILALNVKTLETTVLVNNHVGFVRDMAFDHLGRNLYWADASHKTIEVLSLRKMYRKILVENNQYPTAITLVHQLGLVFVAQRGLRPLIEQMHMDGSNLSIFKRITDGMPSSLAADFSSKRLFWSDSVSGRIGYITFNGEKEAVLKDKIGRPVSLVLHSSRVYWTDEEERKIYWTRAGIRYDHFSIPYNYKKITSSIPKLVIHNSDNKIGEGDFNPCNVNNPCEHLCLLNPTNFTCACATTHVLQSDGFTCKERHNCLKDNFHCHDKSTCLPSAWVCDGDKDCMDGSDELNCTKTCNVHEFKCDHICIPNVWLCDGQNDCPNGADENCENLTCSSSEFRCDNGQCIIKGHVCDREKDCSDGSDEENCKTATCLPDQFRCSTGQCIEKSWVCDDEVDCLEGNDDENEEMCGMSSKCSSNEFTCANTRCIPQSLKCDQNDDCGDNSDEESCVAVSTCPNNEFRCHSNGRCIPPKKRCDSVPDCPDSEDELGCFYHHVCAEDAFKCLNQQCIPKTWVCDGEKDCLQGEDEASDQCYRSTTTALPQPATCPPNQYRCDNSECIAKSLVCNEYADCSDGSDEGIECLSCRHRNGGCQHTCIDKPHGAVCDCYPGYQLSEDNKSCLDIDECNLNICSQNCRNNIGSFTCSCVKGYKLELNGINCKAEGMSPQLLISNPTHIQRLSTHITGHLYNILRTDTHVMSIDFDYRSEFIYWAQPSGIYRNPISKNRIELLLRAAVQTSLIAIDWIAKNLYYVDNDMDVYICTLKSPLKCKTIITSTRIVTSIAVDPNAKLFFWSVRSSTDGRIFRGFLNGDLPKPLPLFKILEPHAITLDFVDKRVYWADSGLGSIETSTYDGEGRRLLTRVPYGPTALTVFEDHLYFSITTKTKRDVLFSCNKRVCENRTKLYEQYAVITDLKTYHAVKQPIGDDNMCKNHECSHICIALETHSVCLCPDFMVFDVNSRTRCVMHPKFQTRENGENSVLNCSLHCNDGDNCYVDNEVVQCITPLRRQGTEASTTSVIIAVVVVLLLLCVAGLGAFYYYKKSNSGSPFASLSRAFNQENIMKQIPTVRFIQKKSWTSSKPRTEDSDRAAILNDREFSNPAFQQLANADEQESLVRKVKPKVRLSLYPSDEEPFLNDDDKSQLI